MLKEGAKNAKNFNPHSREGSDSKNNQKYSLIFVYIDTIIYMR